MNEEEIRTYLPKYLSADSKNALLDALKNFPVITSDKFYTTKLADTEVIYQGDGLAGFIYIELPKLDTKTVNAIVLSNTCDIAKENVRLFESRVVYTPIVSLKKYQSVLTSSGVEREQLSTHIQSIKNQQITQIFFLPAGPGLEDDSLVFFDRTLNIRPEYLGDDDEIKARRLFTLSNYGHYLLLFKLSFHFCRFQDKVDRN